jgi:LPS-assembly protein
LAGSTVETSSHSDLVAEAIAYINDNWSVNAQYQWDTTESVTSLSAVGIKYRGDNGGVLNVSHRYRAENVVKNKEGLEQIDVSALWPMNAKWKWFGRWYHSVEDGRTLEKLAGVQYDSCCWATRFVVRDYVNDIDDDESNLALFFQIELKGLGSLGNKTDDLLSRSIRGFNDY